MTILIALLALWLGATAGFLFGRRRARRLLLEGYSTISPSLSLVALSRRAQLARTLALETSGGFPRRRHELPITWGWKQDPAASGPHSWVLYVDLPTGQVSFHTDRRGTGPDYAGEWDGVREASTGRIIQFCARVLAAQPERGVDDGQKLESEVGQADAGT